MVTYAASDGNAVYVCTTVHMFLFIVFLVYRLEFNGDT